jgi:SNF2-related domain/Helicase conserved C-terminal domain
MASVPSNKKPSPRSRGQRNAPPRPRFHGWATSDEDEIERRRLRGIEEDIAVEPLEPEHGPFGSFRVRSGSGEPYHVEIRSLGERVNSCECPDHQVNRLGTCKHVEATLHRLRREGESDLADWAARGPRRAEVYLDRRDGRLRIAWPKGSRGRSKAHELLSPFFSADGTLLADPLTAVPALRRELDRAAPALRAKIRLSCHLEPWLEDLRHGAERERARAAFLADVAEGKRSLDVVGVPLYPYQQEGMLHLAFAGRALLADEMGLGKTVQAIAACELLRRLHGIERVLVIAPASLKAEWEEQIAKFTGLSSLIVQGPRAARLRQYRERAFFYLMNYEQVRPDRRDIDEILAPDVIILDEAQRIKNWQTKTADAVKRLSSRYAFVLTGTPIENRIDELYSIVQFLDPHVFGPLFRFNRDFYQLDEQGRPAGYKNLDEMHRRLRPVMLRRRKDEVEGQLPGRTVNTFFVAMAEEQAVRYDEYQGKVARLAAQARRRPLTKEELDKLQKWLACMRMLCDTPYILDSKCRLSPKLDELENILADLLEDGDHKIIVFSEWERMLELVRDLAERLELDFAWHTGSTEQGRRRKEIRRFKDDPQCRLFLSTDSGSVGLNLQVADVVINLDLPWNPAKLEQRIARAWRKHQIRAVQVINLVCEHSIEHRMLHLLEQKRTLAQGVVDGAGEVTEMALPSGRAAFLEKVGSLLGEPVVGAKAAEPEQTEDPAERLRQDILARWSERLDLLEIHAAGNGSPTVLAVVDRVDEAARGQITQSAAEHLAAQSPRVEVLDRETYHAIQRLVEAGVLSLNAQGAKSLHQSPAVTTRRAGEREKRLAEARKRFEDARRKQRMARVLAEGGFPGEALAPLREAVETALHSLAYLLGEESVNAVPAEFVQSRLVAEGLVSPGTPSLVARLRDGAEAGSEEQAPELLDMGHGFLGHVANELEKPAFP